MKRKFFEKRDPKERREEIRNKISSLKEKVAAVTPEEMARFARCWLTAKINGARAYTFLNYAIAAMQVEVMGMRPSVIAPFRFWKDKNRSVKKGEKAVYIFAPRLKKEKTAVDSDMEPVEFERSSDTDEQTEKEVSVRDGWLLVPVFDYNQTEGEELDEEEYISGGLHGSWITGSADLFFNDIVSLLPCEVETYKFSMDGENGYTDGRKICIVEKSDDREMIATLIHEWAHFLLHFDSERKDLARDVRELEAETVAYVVCDCIGLTSAKSPLYLKGWDRSLSGYEHVRIEKIVSAVEKILTALAFEGTETEA